ncbi:MAG: PKD domain-containing protein [Verrucomicrobia bacterium]|nr:PKD domain-containing protein [Verrucomicrobiota bacterium]
MKRIAVLLVIVAAFGLMVFLYPRSAPNRRSVSSSDSVSGTTNLLRNQAGSISSNQVASALKPGASAANSPPGFESTNNAVSNFSLWAAKFLSGDTTASLAHGEALAWKRRKAMLELIETDPETAISLAVPYEWRLALPPRITRHFEQWVDGRGDLTVAVATDFDRGATRTYREATVDGKQFIAFVYGPRKGQVSRPGISLHGIVLGGKMAVSADAIRILSLKEAEALEKERGQTPDLICGVSSQPSDYRQQQVAADVGGEIKFFCGTDHARMVNKRLLLAASGGSNGGNGSLATAGNNAWTHGRKNVLYMRLNFPDDLTEPISEAAAYDVMDDVNDFYTTGSYDVTSLSPTVTPLMTLPETKNWYSTAGPGALMSAARSAARNAGFETANYDLDIAAFTSVPEYDFGGLGAVHGKGTWLQSMGEGVTVHELGHNYGLWHANFWDTTNTSAIGTGTNREYGNVFDTMGAAGGGSRQFNTMHKNILDWLPDIAVQTLTNGGVCRVFPYDTPTRQDGRFYAAKVVKDYGRDYWIEFRQNFSTSNPHLQNGVQLNWSPWEESNGGTQLIDTSPDTSTLNDSPLVIGRTFTDAAAGVHITPIARGTAGTDTWIDVRVTTGNPTPNWAPWLDVEVDTTNAAPGELVHFHATAFDLDGDSLAYAWTFDDGSFSTNNQPWTFKSWSQPGEHVVRCEVSDMRGGVASANVIATVGGPTGFRVTGVVLDANDDPIEGARVGDITNNIICYTDSDGSYVLTGLNGDYFLEATKYGCTFTNLVWENPFTVTSNRTHTDFLASALPTVRVEAGTNAVPETGGITYFKVTRTGEITNDLAVKVFLSGTDDSATLHIPGVTTTGDFMLTPAVLGPALNTLTIPAGAQSVTLAFQTVGDTITEVDEVASLYIVSDTNYIVALSGAASVKILDDDLAGQPSVSVSTVTPTVPENGMDRGTFLLSRAGNTRNPLTVFYSVAGTATGGTDYGSLAGVAIFPAGAETTTIQFKTLDDKLVEPDETVSVTLTPNAAYTLGTSTAQLAITDDDVTTVTIFPTGSGASETGGPGIFTVKRDGDLTSALVVFYTTNGTATSGLDYTPLPGAVTIPPGATSADFMLSPLDDALLEGDESVLITLVTNVAYSVDRPGLAKMFIRDDELASVSVAVLDATATEPGEDTGSFRISRGPVINGDLTVNLAINGTAISGADYVPFDNPVIIPDGQSSVTLELIAFDDLHQEPDETVIVTILPSTNYNITAPGQARAFIVDEDLSNVPAVGFSFSASGAEENKSPGIGVSLSMTSAVPITVDYVVIGGTASPADYSLPPPPLTFDPGDRALSIPLTIINDTTNEANETIRIALFNPIGATLDGIKIHTYTIINDDSSSVSVTATATTASETGTAGNFRITRIGATNAALQVNFEITGTASAPTDYASVGTNATIPAGATFVDLPVTPVNDLTVEPAETVKITLLSAPGSKLVAPNVATITITDNDPDTLPDVVVTSTNQPYAVEGGGNGAFVFTRSGSTTGALTIPLTIAGTASSGADYAALPSFVTIPIGQSSTTLLVTPVNDSAIEGEETVVVALTAGETYRVAFPSAATVTIQDNDQRVWLDASDFDASEPGDTDPGDFTFTRFGTTNTPLQVFFTITGTASNGVDYAAISNSFVIPAGVLTAKLPITPLDDPLVEGPETVTITLQPNAAYTLGAPTTDTVTIMDDEPMLRLVANATDIVEGQKDPGILTVQRGGNPDYEFTARLSIGGTAAYGVDYPPFATNVFFNCGITAIDLYISPTNELVIEPSETVTAVIVPDPAYTILSPSNAVVTIADAGSNRSPIVKFTSPTSDLVYLLGTNANMILEAMVIDNGVTNPPVSLTWTNVGGAETYSYGTTNQFTNTVSFSNDGVYVLRLIADDGLLSSHADVTVMVDTLGRLSTNLLHWTFDEASGANVLDSSGNGHTGVIVGPASRVTNGISGRALNLNGTNNFVRELVDSALLNGRKQFSLSFWVRPAATNPALGMFTADSSGTNSTWTLGTRPSTSCSSFTNVIEATFVTSRAKARHASANNSTTNDWQHIALTWSNGLAPALFINGGPDQPGKQWVSMKGFVTNCPQFIFGKGAADVTNTWRGLVDELVVFPRALHAAEVGGLVATNYGAVVTVPTNFTCPIFTDVILPASVTDDNRPNPPGVVTTTWVQVDGPANVVITNANSISNTVWFTQAGEYVFRLIADDGQVKTYDDLDVTVTEPTQVNVIATDSDAAELGPDTAELMFTRVGDTNFNLTVLLAISGTASNGADFPHIPLTNSVTFAAGVESIIYPIVPFLDHRTEGDEQFICTILTNIAYYIGSSPGTVTIHDSPYGMWNIANFTLEELTLPNLSGEDADFDSDTRMNFVEYVANTNPKFGEPGAPLVSVIESNPTNGTHITFTYTRRIEPTDVSYQAVVSDDLLTWHSGTNYVQEISVTDDGNNLTETVFSQVVAPWPNGTSQFITVRVWLRATGP